MGRSAARCDICAAEFAVPGPFPVILATLSAPSIASATMCSMCRCGVTCSENVRDACRTPPDAPLRPDAKRAFPLLPRTLASRFGKISSPAAGPHIPIVWSPPPLAHMTRIAHIAHCPCSLTTAPRAAPFAAAISAIKKRSTAYGRPRAPRRGRPRTGQRPSRSAAYLLA